MTADARTKILEILDGPDVYEIVMQDGSIGAQILADRLVELFNSIDQHDRCDFDCDNCHTGGCGNPLCERMSCPEENAARAAYEKTMEGHTILKCPICKTVLCEIDARWNSK